VQELAQLFNDPIAKLKLVTECLVNEADASGTTPLMTAVLYNHREALDELLKEGAEVELKDAGGYSALRHGIHHGEHEHRIQFIDVLLEAKASPNSYDLTTTSMLTHAAGKGHTKIMERLLKAGADINVGGGSGYTALKRAALHGQVDALHAMCVKFDEAWITSLLCNYLRSEIIHNTTSLLWT